jgi:hypothetical protein
MTNKDHRWQGSFRVGHFDQVAAQYALQACGEGEIDGVVLTCVDRLWSKDTWEISQEYTTECRDPDLESLFDCFENEARDHEVIYGIKANPNGEGPAHLVRQEKIAKVLATCKPLLTNMRMAGGDLRKEWVDATAEFVSSTLKTRVVAVSVGQTEEDKIEIK